MKPLDATTKLSTEGNSIERPPAKPSRSPLQDQHPYSQQLQVPAGNYTSIPVPRIKVPIGGSKLYICFSEASRAIFLAITCTTSASGFFDARPTTFVTSQARSASLMKSLPALTSIWILLHFSLSLLAFFFLDFWLFRDSSKSFS